MREYKRYALGIRISALTLYDAGIPMPIIYQKYGCTPSSVFRWARIAKQRGWHPETNPIITAEYLEDALQPGRPTVQTWERTKQLIAEATGSKEGRNLSSRSLGAKLGVSARTACRMLKKHKFRLCKESTKPGLTEAIMKARLDFCEAYED